MLSSSRLCSCAVAFALLGCSGDQPAEPAIDDPEVRPVRFHFSRSGEDARGFYFLLRFDEGYEVLVAPGDSASIGAEVGPVHLVTVHGLPGHCTTPQNPVPFSAASGRASTIEVPVHCRNAPDGAVQYALFGYDRVIGYDRTGNGIIDLSAGMPHREIRSAPSWSSYGLLAFLTGLGESSELVILDPDDGRTAVLGSDRPPWTASDLAWSPDGSAIAVSSDSSVLVYPIDGGPPSRVPVAAASPESIEWSRDGAWLATTGWGSLRVVAARAAQPPVVALDALDVHSPAFSPDGKAVAFAVRELSYGGGGIGGCTLIGCNQAHGAGPHGLWIAPLDGSAAFRVLETSVYAVAWWPDGSRIAYTGLDDEIFTVAPEPDATPLSLGMHGVLVPSADGRDLLLIEPTAVRSITGQPVPWSPLDPHSAAAILQLRGSPRP